MEGQLSLLRLAIAASPDCTRRERQTENAKVHRGQSSAHEHTLHPPTRRQPHLTEHRSHPPPLIPVLLLAISRLEHG